MNTTPSGPSTRVTDNPGSSVTTPTTPASTSPARIAFGSNNLGSGTTSRTWISCVMDTVVVPSGEEAVTLTTYVPGAGRGAKFRVPSMCVQSSGGSADHPTTGPQPSTVTSMPSQAPSVKPTKSVPTGPMAVMEGGRVPSSKTPSQSSSAPLQRSRAPGKTSGSSSAQSPSASLTPSWSRSASTPQSEAPWTLMRDPIARSRSSQPSPSRSATAKSVTISETKTTGSAPRAR